MTRPVCRKCLLYESGEEIYQTIYNYIKSIPAEQKTPKCEYESRLGVCKACDHLINGMCELCGCYIEVRAAKIKQKCVKYYW